MSNKQQSKRTSRKNVMRSFEDHIDLARLDYARRAKPGKDVAKVTGLVFAATVLVSLFSIRRIKDVGLADIIRHHG